MIISEEDYVAHYGVKGMKWGVRKKDDGSGRSGSAGTKDKSGKVGTSEDTAILAIYGGAIAAVLLARAAMSVVKRRDSGIREAKQSGDRPFKEDPKLKGKKTVSQLERDVVKQINPDYPGKGTQMNCRRATLAYEMRRRGYDVKATKSNYATGQDQKGIENATGLDRKSFESSWGQKEVASPRVFASATPEKRARMVFDSLGKYPNGARGELAVGWTLGGGHSVAWEVVNNKPVIFDTQSSKTYSSPKALQEFTPILYEAAHTRLDTVPINDQFIRRWVTDAA